MRLVLLLLLALGATACDDAAATNDGGPDAEPPSCGVVPDDAPNCGVVQCPAACDLFESCDRFCGGGDCYTCSSGNWKLVTYSCRGDVCTAPDAGIVDATPPPG